MTPELQSRVDAAVALAEKATPPPWSWWTSNSVKRLSHERDGDVLYAYRPHRGDPQADVCVRAEDMDFIAASHDHVDLIRDLADALRASEAQVEALRVELREQEGYPGIADDFERIKRFLRDFVNYPGMRRHVGVLLYDDACMALKVADLPAWKRDRT